MTATAGKISIHDDDRVLRRVEYLDPNFIKDDGTPASSGFSLKKLENGEWEKGLSVDVESLTTYEKSIQDKIRSASLHCKFLL